MSLVLLPNMNPALRHRIDELKAFRWKQAELLDSLEALELKFGSLSEAQYNTWANAEHKFDEASESLCKLGVIALRWNTPDFD